MSMDRKVSLLPRVKFMYSDYYTLLPALDLLSMSKQCQPRFGPCILVVDVYTHRFCNIQRVHIEMTISEFKAVFKILDLSIYAIKDIISMSLFPIFLVLSRIKHDLISFFFLLSLGGKMFFPNQIFKMRSKIVIEAATLWYVLSPKLHQPHFLQLPFMTKNAMWHHLRSQFETLFVSQHHLNLNTLCSQTKLVQYWGQLFIRI